MWDMTHCLCETWLIVYVRHDSWFTWDMTRGLCETWLVVYACHDSFVRDMTHRMRDMQNMENIAEWARNVCSFAKHCELILVGLDIIKWSLRHDSFRCVRHVMSHVTLTRHPLCHAQKTWVMSLSWVTSHTWVTHSISTWEAIKSRSCSIECVMAHSLCGPWLIDTWHDSLHAWHREQSRTSRVRPIEGVMAHSLCEKWNVCISKMESTQNTSKWDMTHSEVLVCIFYMIPNPTRKFRRAFWAGSWRRRERKREANWEKGKDSERVREGEG